MRRARWPVAIVVSALALGTTVYVMVVRGYYQDVAPSPGTTIEALSKHIGFRSIREVEKAGSVFYMAEGNLPPGYVLASGPPVYVFDSKGRLVEWIKDGGDQPSSMRKWGTLPSQEVSLEHVLLNVKEQ